MTVDGKRERALQTLRSFVDVGIRDHREDVQFHFNQWTTDAIKAAIEILEQDKTKVLRERIAKLNEEWESDYDRAAHQGESCLVQSRILDILKELSEL